jgi:hypothetical protein
MSLTIAEAIKRDAGVLEHHVLTDPDGAVDGLVRYGWAFPWRGIIYAPEGRTDRELYTLAHECAHVALRHDRRKPLWRREYEAELWAHDALWRHGIPVHEDDKADACWATKTDRRGGGGVERLESLSRHGGR